MREEAAINIAIAGAGAILYLPVVRVLPELLRSGENPLLILALLPFAAALLLGLLHKWRRASGGETS